MDDFLNETKNFFEKLFLKSNEDINRDGLKHTHQRFLNAFSELTDGYNQKLNEIVNNAIFDCDNNNPVVLKDIQFYSLCEHHLLPFFGKCTVYYIPNKKIIGLSKIYRIIEMFSKRLQIQERLTEEVAKAINEVLSPEGIYVKMIAEHLCVSMRGIKKANSIVETSYRIGKHIEEDVTFLNKLDKKPELSIKTLEIPLSIGCYDYERKEKTNVTISVCIKSDQLYKSCETDNIYDTLCYDKLSKELVDFCKDKHFNLIEHCAYNICDFIKNKIKYLVDNEVVVSVTKKLKHPILSHSKITIVQ